MGLKEKYMQDIRGKIHLSKKVLVILIIMLCYLNCLTIISYGKSETVNPITVNNNREPRIQISKTNKNYLIIFFHDNTGIKTEKTIITFDGKQRKIQLFENYNNGVETTGVYTNKGLRIKDLKNSTTYEEKKYDYGIKINNSELSNTSYKNVSVTIYDYEGSCYITETFKIKKLNKANKNGEWYIVNNAPRTTTKVIKYILKICSRDNNGIKKLSVLSDKTNEEIYRFNASKSNITSLKGVKKEGIIYPYELTDDISMDKLKKAQIESNKYKVKVIAEDSSGIKNTKTMIITIKDSQKLSDVQKAIQEVEYSYYMRGNGLQYNSAKRLTTESISPEEATRQNRGYIVCSGFTHNVYNQVFGITIPTGSNGLISYTKENIGRPEVILYGNNVNKKNQLTIYKNGKVEKKTSSPDLMNDIISRLQVRRCNDLYRSYSDGI